MPKHDRAARPVSVFALALTVALGGAASCSFGPVEDAGRIPVNTPRAVEPAPDNWLDTIARGIPPAPTPSGRAEDPQRPLRRTAAPDVTFSTLPQTPARFRKQATRHLGQWTGRAPNVVDALGFSGTDLGVSFAHRGRLWFLFGDSKSVFDYAQDSIASVPLAPLEAALPKLQWNTRPNGTFAPIKVPGVDLGFMNVAVEGLSLGDTAYVFLATGWADAQGKHLSSALAHATGPNLDQFQLDHLAASQRFLNVSAVFQEPYVYIWGSGEFRKSDVYLARVRAEALADRTAWEYFQGWRADGPVFSPGEENARPIVDPGCVGELSVRRHPTLGMYLLAYNCEEPRSVFLQTADSPAGPYSEPIQLFEPWLDDGYEHFIHAAPSMTGRDDGLGEIGREADPGGEYGPYLVPEWFSEEPGGGHAIVYTLSSWNPYQVQLLQTVLVDVAAPALPDPPNDVWGAGGSTLAALNSQVRDSAAWSREGDGFAVSQASDGSLVMASDAAPLGAAATGTFWYDFWIDQSVSTLEFEIRGGGAEVLLVADDEIVRRARGERDNAWRPVAFQLASLRGRALRLAIYDRASDAWGFVQVRNVSLR